MDPTVKLIQRFTGLPEEVITDESNLIEDLGMDSITLYEVISAAEAEFEVEELPNEALADIKTVKDVKEAIRKYTLSI